MKKIVKKLVKILIIYIVINMLVLSNVCYGYTSAEVGAAVAGFAEYILTTYSTSAYGGDGELQYNSNRRQENPFWNTSMASTYANTPWYFDCSSFATAVYNYVCGDYILGDSTWPATTGTIESDSDFEDLGSYSASIAQPGDLICSSTHVEVLVSVEKGSGGAHGLNYGVYLQGDGTVSPSEGHIYRLKDSVASSLTALNTTYSSGTISSSSKSSSSSVNFSNFYFNGIPDGKYSVAHTSILSTIIETLASIADYLIGILTYLIRIVIVGWTSLIDRLFTWSVNTVVDTGVDAEDLNVSSVEVESADNDDRITIEKLLYNEYDLTNINIFDNDDSDTNEDDTDNLETSGDTEDADTTGDIQ